MALLPELEAFAGKRAARKAVVEAIAAARLIDWLFRNLPRTPLPRLKPFG